MVQNVVLVFLRRRLSQRPNVEELESRNILKRKFKKDPKTCLQAAASVIFLFFFFLKKYRFVRLKARTVERRVVHW